MKGFNFYTYPEQAINSLPLNMRTSMRINNPFGMEIDDDGLPKYSPDRKNITAYHMYKLGLTDKLPDPEDTHTPFFRTPSYYEEKAEKERLAQSGSPAPFETRPARPDMPDIVSQTPSQSGENPHFPHPADKQEPFQPDTGMPSAGQNRNREITDGTGFGRQVLKHIFGERRPPYQNPFPDFRLSGQTVPAPIREEPAAPAQGQATPSPASPQPVQRQPHVSRPAQVPSQPENTTPAPSGTRGTGDTGNATSMENAMNTFNQAFGQFNSAATEDDIRTMYGYSKTQGSDGQTNAAGKTNGFSNPSQQTSPDNGSCAPLPVRPVDGIVPKRNRRLITPEETEDINAELTRKNGCRPVGINNGLLSQYEGGSHKKAYVPWSEKTAKGNSSGVTIGSGFDLGQRKRPDELRAMGLPESLVQKFAPYLGKKRSDAVKFLRDHPLTLSEDETNILNRCILIDMGKKAIRHWDAEIDKQRKTWPDAPYFHEMNTDQQTIVFSRYYNEGQGWIKNHPDIHQSILRNDWDTAGKQWYEQIQRYKNSGQGWKGDRFSQEHEFLWGNKEH